VACGLWTASHVSRAVNFFDLSKADVMPLATGRSPRAARHGPLATGRSPRAARHGPLATGWSGSANSPPDRVQWPPSKVILCLGAMDNFFGFRQIVDK
jgi:hypothetical protein